jgi:hypothetical protein
MTKYVLTKGDGDINVITTLDYLNKYVVWFFGCDHELLRGTVSDALDRCSHRIFNDDVEFNNNILLPLLSDGWSQLNNDP